VGRDTNYLAKNKTYWEKGYTAPNVDHPVFRFYGRILKHIKSDWQDVRLVDFGCGQGAAVEFFSRHGFNVKGVDFSETDVAAAQIRYPHLADRFLICAPKPSDNNFYGFVDGIGVITAIQSLYYLSDEDFSDCIQMLYQSMEVGGIFFATMMGERCAEFFENSEPIDNGLRVVKFKNDRIDVDDYCISFIRDEEHLQQKFEMFKPLHIGYYAGKFRNDEGDNFHYTFCGIKT